MRFLIPDGLLFSAGAAVIVQVADERAENPIHDKILNTDIFNRSPAPAPRFNADSAVGLFKDTVAHDNIADSAAHLASEHDAPVPVDHGAVGDSDIARLDPLRRRFRSGFYGNAVVSDVNMTVGNMNVLAGIRINAVRIGRIRRVPDRNSGHRNPVAFNRVDGPSRGIDQHKIPDLDIPAVVKTDELRAGIIQHF